MDYCIKGDIRVRRASVADNITLFYNPRSDHSPCLLGLLSLTIHIHDEYFEILSLYASSSNMADLL